MSQLRSLAKSNRSVLSNGIGWEGQDICLVFVGFTLNTSGCSRSSFVLTVLGKSSFMTDNCGSLHFSSSERMQVGFTTLRGLVIQRPSLQMDALHVLCELTTHPDESNLSFTLVFIPNAFANEQKNGHGVLP